MDFLKYINDEKISVEKLKLIIEAKKVVMMPVPSFTDGLHIARRHAEYEKYRAMKEEKQEEAQDNHFNQGGN